LKALILLLLLQGCAWMGPSIDYSKRTRPQSTDITYEYPDNSWSRCAELKSPFAYSCTYFPDVRGWNDPNPEHWKRAIIVLPKSEKDKPTFLTKHEQAHADGYDH